MSARDRGLWFWTGVALFGLALAFAVTDLAAGWPDLWQHSMFTEVFAGLLLLGVTVFWIDTVVRRREDSARERELEARWQGLGGIGFRSLGNALGDVVDGMAWLVTGAHPLDRPRDMRDDQVVRLSELFERCGLEPEATQDTGDFTARVFDDRLTPLLGSQEWCRFAHDTLDVLKWRFRDRIGGWASPMLALEDLAAILRRASIVDDRVSRLQAALRPLAGWAGTSSEARAAARWFSTLGEAMTFREDLQRVALAEGGESFASSAAALQDWVKFRRWLRPGLRDVATRRADAAQEDPDRWRQRSRDAVRLRVGCTDALITYWASAQARQGESPVTRWFRSSTPFPSDSDPP